MNTAFLLVCPESETYMEEFVTDFPDVKEVNIISGDYPFLLRVEARDLGSIKTTISDIRYSHKIKSTMCLLSTNSD